MSILVLFRHRSSAAAEIGAVVLYFAHLARVTTTKLMSSELDVLDQRAVWSGIVAIQYWSCKLRTVLYSFCVNYLKN